MKPFIKFVGGKYKLLPQLIPLLPDMANVHTYIEPFLGSGAMFFALEFDEGDRVVLGDQNAALIDVYRCVRDCHVAVLSYLYLLAEQHKTYRKEKYARARKQFNEGYGSPAERAALFLYLNKTCFNGIWRVNSKGEFNVPIGDYEDPVIYNPGTIAAASKHLQQTRFGVQLVHGDFVATVERAAVEVVREVFVYFDPPYVPASQTADFTSYTAAKFDAVDLERLKDLCCELDYHGVKFMLSNSNTPAVREAFKDFEITSVTRGGSINSDVKKRGPVTELVIRNYE